MERYDVVALGELLIDFTNNGASEQGTHDELLSKGTFYKELVTSE